ncbi:MAG TPA: hypothetical protein VFR80_09870 [Pyrinomonadaceae bacterium]|nr:hypothetical protein [Pyrinomonadaceae bacterium]
MSRILAVLGGFDFVPGVGIAGNVSEGKRAPSGFAVTRFSTGAVATIDETFVSMCY